MTRILSFENFSICRSLPRKVRTPNTRLVTYLRDDVNFAPIPVGTNAKLDRLRPNGVRTLFIGTAHPLIVLDRGHPVNSRSPRRTYVVFVPSRVAFPSLVSVLMFGSFSTHRPKCCDMLHHVISFFTMV
jgi:hypothetical protein